MIGAVFLLIYLSGSGSENTLKQSIAQDTVKRIQKQFLPLTSFAEEPSGQLNNLLPLYGYVKEHSPVISEDEERLITMDALMTEENLLEENMLAENRSAAEAAQIQKQGQVQEMPQEQELQPQPVIEDAGFVPHTLMQEVDLNLFRDYEALVKNFYTIDATTMAGSEQLNLDKLLEKDMRISKEGEAPQILIYHTHSQEGFADSVSGDKSTTIVGVGDRLTEILTNIYGYKVLHHTGEYDVTARDDAYSESLPAIEQLLNENPSIEVIIDLHRDQMPEGTKLVMDLDGRPTARFMFFNGMSRTKKTGNISYLYNENLQDNLSFSFQMQLAAARYYPGLTRKIYLKGYRYNMHLRPKTLLVELGAQNNTVEEAMNACDPLAHILDIVLSGQG